MDRDRKAARAMLDAVSTMTLACADDRGPWAADVYFVRFGRALYFFSSPDSRHAKALAEDPRAAATVHGVYEGWEDIRGLQIAGRVEEVRDVTRKTRALAAYLAKFPFSRDVFARGGLREKVALFRLLPRRILLIDNSRGFGHRTEAGP